MLNPAPVKTPAVDGSGMPTVPWTQFYTSLVSEINALRLKVDEMSKKGAA